MRYGFGRFPFSKYLWIAAMILMFGESVNVHSWFLAGAFAFFAVADAIMIDIQKSKQKKTDNHTTK